jgi:hypothetical protein
MPQDKIANAHSLPETQFYLFASIATDGISRDEGIRNFVSNRAEEM